MGWNSRADPFDLEREMAGKNKGGREIRKPKQAKKPKDAGVAPPIAPQTKVKRPAPR
jgi:hypothetical protein